VIFTRSFLVATFERALKTFAQALLAFIPAAGTGAVPELNWGDMLVLSGYAALASLLFSIVSSGVGGTGPSLANEVISPPAVDPGPEDGATVSELALIVCAACLVVLVVVALT
jgi:hypothetical protein